MRSAIRLRRFLEFTRLHGFRFPRFPARLNIQFQRFIQISFLFFPFLPLWIRGRYFLDLVENKKHDPAADKPYAARPLQIGRMAGGKFVAAASANTDAQGVFDFRFVGLVWAVARRKGIVDV